MKVTSPVTTIAGRYDAETDPKLSHENRVPAAIAANVNEKKL